MHGLFGGSFNLEVLQIFVSPPNLNVDNVITNSMAIVFTSNITYILYTSTRVIYVTIVISCFSNKVTSIAIFYKYVPVTNKST